FTAVIFGGDSKQGMFNGAWTAGFAYIFNETLEEFGNRMNYMFKRAGIGTDPGHLFSRRGVESLNPGLTNGQINALATLTIGVGSIVFGSLNFEAPFGPPLLVLV
ncbi:MAG: hypothetical protein AAGU32_11160, partial [Bacillota bacterium]